MSSQKKQRTRIKMCGITRLQDLEAAVESGVDAVGFVFYPASPRSVAPEQAVQLLVHLPPFIQAVGLFVNASDEWMQRVCETVPLSLLQFHGDETGQRCQALANRYVLPYLPAARVRPGFDLLKFAAQHPTASGLLLDAFVDGYGGAGKTFDWSLIPSVWLAGEGPKLVLSGGLDADNVADAIRHVRPYAVDVSSGIELAKGIKDPARMRAFVEAVRMADAAGMAD